jgi:hypothetical protein
MSITITVKDYIVKRRKGKKNMKDYSTWPKKKTKNQFEGQN